MSIRGRCPSSPVVLAILVLAVTGCDGPAGPAEIATVTADPTTGTPSPSDLAPTTASAAPSTTPTASPTATAAAASSTATPSVDPTSESPTAVPTGGPGTYPNGEAPLDLSQTSGAGTTVDLTRIEVEGDTLSIDVSALNAADNVAYLATSGGSTSDAIRVTVGDGPPLLYRPAADNPTLEIPSGSELTGTVSFVGRIPADARTVTVAFNARAVLDNAATPQFTFEDVPLP